MKLLALDTSSLACSVAICVGDKVFEQHEEQAREHTRLLIPMIRSVLAEADVSIPELDAIVLGNGPGSFIGVRIAASVVQGIAFGSGLKVAPVSSMQAVAAEAIERHGASEVVVTQDAHMNEVYLGRYGGDPGGLAEPLSAECLHGQGEMPGLAAERDGKRVAAGFGWQRYPQLLAANEAFFDAVTDTWYPRARFLLAPGARVVAQGASVSPEDISPAYLRRKVAEVPAKKRP